MEPVKVPQVQFATLEEFIEGSNNFFSTFLNNHRSRRNHPFYQRFRSLYPELCSFLEQEITIKNYNKPRIPIEKKWPWEKLWEAYSLMSELIYLGDPGVIDKDHRTFLLR